MKCAFPLFALVLLADYALAEDTNITVRVVARNAQYVGDLVHGALITITDAASGEMLVQGTTREMPAIRNARCRPHANGVNR